MLKFSQVSKKYNNHLVFDIENLELGKGIYWLQGANGSGKTTLLKVIAGLLPFKGELSLNEINITKYPKEFRKLISWSEAEPLYPEMITGAELIHFYQDVLRVPQPKMDRLIYQFGVKNFMNAQSATYSSGMLKRLSLLLAFCAQSPLIILDEPMANLDQEMLATLPALMNEYQNDFGSSFLFSSHQTFEKGSLHNERRLSIEKGSIQIIS